MQRKLGMAHNCKVQSAAFIEAKENEFIKNDMASCATECIAVGPSKNWQGSTVCVNLGTGVVVVYCTIQEVHMLDRIKDTFNKWGN